MANTLEQGSCHSNCGTGWNGEEGLADTAPFLTSHCSRAPGLPLYANKVLLGVSTLLDNCLAQVHSKVLVPQSSPCVSVALLPDSFAVTQLVSSKRKINPGAVLETFHFRDHTQTAAWVSLDQVWVSLLCTVTPTLSLVASGTKTPSHVPDNAT